VCSSDLLPHPGSRVPELAETEVVDAGEVKGPQEVQIEKRILDPRLDRDLAEVLLSVGCVRPQR
jgi:hypothetical protein